MNKQKINYQDVIGWGIDADPFNEPTYPMKKKDTENDLPVWERPEQQVTSVEVLHSNERPSLPAVFGQTLPPRDFSGMIRRYAFKHSESRYRHWLSLLVADRVNELEGIVADLKKGKWPNMWEERGWSAQWKFGKEKILKKAGVGLACLIVLRMLVRQQK